MTPEEIICEFMEPKPGGLASRHEVKERWWIWRWHHIGPSLPQQQTPVEYTWLPRILTLDALHEVETKLTEPQKQHYMSHIASLDGLVGRFYEDAWVYLHATAEQKIKALAGVIGRKA